MLGCAVDFSRDKRFRGDPRNYTAIVYFKPPPPVTSSSSSSNNNNNGKDGDNDDGTSGTNLGGGFGVWEGFGTSLAWWAVAFGDREDVADLFFTTKHSLTLPEVRSGGTNNDGVSESVSQCISDSRVLPSFLPSFLLSRC